MRKVQALVVYYDGNEFSSKVSESTTPDSAMPHVWGLPDDYSIHCVIIFDKKTSGRIYIDEQATHFEVKGYDDE